jgi:hypothetical protein
MNQNTTKFHTELIKAYSDLFINNPDYAYSAARNTPTQLADKMIGPLASGGANYDGEGIKRACKACGIKYTGKAVRDFLNTY